ncbi:MAG: ParB/RepB/Spo0J family partition protein [Acidimicrobiia bacterium]|nr:ParB/RepB/Spo0J family partition protein [Acidimicrobiia bacterium]
MSRRSGLGRGLGALIPPELMREADGELRELPVGSIDANRYQPREHFDEETLVALAESIRVLGVLQPVLVRPNDDDRYELIAGERRWRAARRAGLTTIPAIVRTVTDTVSLEQALVENLHRDDLNPLEEAAAYQQLVEDFRLTQEEVASRVGRSRSAVANTLRLLHLPPTIQRLVGERRLSAGHARTLLGTPDRSFQEGLAQRIVSEGLSVRQTEEAVRRRSELAGTLAPLPSASARTGEELDGPVVSSSSPAAVAAAPSAQGPPTGRSPSSGPSGATAAASSAAGPPALLELEQLLVDYLDTSVSVTLTRNRGKLVVDFADLDDLERIYRLIADS